MSDQLISREALKEAFADMREGYPIFSDTEMVSTKDIASIIDNAPTVDVYYTNDDISEAIKEGFANGYEMAKAKYEIPQGKWEDIGYGLHRCDRCGLEVKIPTNYCSFCGSHKQEGGAE